MKATVAHFTRGDKFIINHKAYKKHEVWLVIDVQPETEQFKAAIKCIDVREADARKDQGRTPATLTLTDQHLEVYDILWA